MIDYEYKFIKGQGWVYSPVNRYPDGRVIPIKPESFTMEGCEGRMVTVLDRMPMVGEYAWHVDSYCSLQGAANKVALYYHSIKDRTYGWLVSDEADWYNEVKDSGWKTLTVVTHD